LVLEHVPAAVLVAREAQGQFFVTAAPELEPGANRQSTELREMSFHKI